MFVCICGFDPWPPPQTTAPPQQHRRRSGSPGDFSGMVWNLDRAPERPGVPGSVFFRLVFGGLLAFLCILYFFFLFGVLGLLGVNLLISVKVCCCRNFFLVWGVRSIFLKGFFGAVSRTLMELRPLKARTPTSCWWAAGLGNPRN